MSLINDALKRANEAQKKRTPSGPLGVPLQPVHSLKPQRSLLPVVVFPIVLLAVLGGAFWLISSGLKSQPKPAETVPPPSVPVSKPAPVARVEAPVVKPPEPKHTAPPAPVVVEHPAAVMKPAPPVTVATAPKPKPAVVTPPVEPKPVAPVAPVATVIKPVVVESPSKPVEVAMIPKPTPPPEVPVAHVEPAATPAPAPAVTTPEPAAAFPDLKLQGIFFRLSKPSVLISGRTLYVGEKVMGAKVVEIDRLNVTMEFNGQKKVLSLE